MIRRARDWARARASALVILLVVGVLGGSGLVWNAEQARQAKDQARQTQQEFRHLEQEQARQGRVVERKLCTTFSGLAELQPPAGSAKDNPSRAYLQGEHARLAQVGPDIGCPGATP